MSEHAWRKLGVGLENAYSAEGALKQGLLSEWNVRKVPLTATLPENARGVSRVVPVTERVAVVRDSPVISGQVDHLGIVSPTYAVSQNEDQIGLLDALAEESGATFDCAGEMDGGRKAFVNLRLPGHMVVGGTDALACTVATVKSHDGSKPYVVLVTPIQVATGTVLASYPIVRVRHSSGAGAVIEQQARSALDRAFDYLTGFQATAERLAAETMSFAKFEAVVERVYGAGDDASAAALTRSDKRVAEITELFGTGHTAWAGFTALATWFDAHSPVRGGTSREQKAVLDPGFKERALRLMEEV